MLSEPLPDPQPTPSMPPEGDLMQLNDPAQQVPVTVETHIPIAAGQPNMEERHQIQMHQLNRIADDMYDLHVPNEDALARQHIDPVGIEGLQDNPNPLDLTQQIGGVQ